MPTELMREGDHLMTVCNACRYCEGYCAVWQAMERRLVFNEGDLRYLANLCHNCSDCYYACQYAPPHEFDINPPKTLAKIRVHSYERYAWPGALAALFRQNGVIVSLLTALSLIVFLFLGRSLTGEAGLTVAVPGGDFYRITSHHLLVFIFGAVGLFAALALLIGVLRFWKDVGEQYSELAKVSAWGKAVKDVLRLEYLDNGGYGCTYPQEHSSQAMRWFHHLTFYGFACCFVATTLGVIYHYLFGWSAPYGYTSLPVLFGTVGGVGLAIGPIGLWWLKCQRNRDITDQTQYGMDVSFLLLVWLSGVSGLLLLALRETAAMPSLLIVHLGIVMALFLTFPYGKFVHGVYRSAAILKYALERERPPEHNVEV